MVAPYNGLLTVPSCVTLVATVVLLVRTRVLLEALYPRPVAFLKVYYDFAGASAAVFKYPRGRALESW